MEYNWKDLAESQLRAVQILTNEIDRVNAENRKLLHELEVSNNSLKTLLNEQNDLVDRIGQLEYLLKDNKPYEAPKETKVIQEDLFDKTIDRTKKE